jgi:hypothetical protein
MELKGKPIRGNKSGRTFGKDTPTYRLFEKLFLDLGEDQLPYTLPPMPKGQAINAAIGLNRCQVQWAKEQCLDASFLTRSAKAKDPAREDGLWHLEISRNERHTYTGPAWMNKFLEMDTGSSRAPGVSSQGDELAPAVTAPPIPEAEPEDSSAEKAILGWLSGGGQP